GIGVEVAGTVAGLAAVDLVGVAQGLAVVGHELQVDGQGLSAAAEGLGQVALQGAVEAALQLRDRGQGSQQGIVGGRIGGRSPQGSAGGGQGADTRGSPKENGPQDAGLAGGAVVFQADIPLADVLGIGVDGAAGDGILPGLHGPLLV